MSASSAGIQNTASEAAPGLRVYSVREIELAYDRQRKDFDWDLSREREFMENLFCQRFNFFLLAYSLFVTAVATGSSSMRTAVGFAGGLVCFTVWLTIWRAYVKLMVNLTMLYSLSSHPIGMVNRETTALGARRLFPVNPLLAFVVPAICTFSLVAAGIASMLKYW